MARSKVVIATRGMNPAPCESMTIAQALREALAGQSFVLSPEESERELDDRARRYLGIGLADFERQVSQGTIAPSTSASYIEMLAEPDRS
jgi:hypothetical protein